MQIDVPLTDPQADFVFSEAVHPAIIGGLGCVHPDTKVWTERGLMRIADLSAPIRVLSWNEKDQQFQLSLSGGSFPKGRANLVRVVTKQGEFHATEHHRFFSSDRTYLQAGEVADGCSALQASPFLLRSMMECGLLSFPSSEQHLSQTNASLMGSYADAARQYGQQLLMEEGIDRSLFPLQGDAHTSFRGCDRNDNGRMGGVLRCLQERSHHDLLSDHACKRDFEIQMGEPALGEAHHTSSLLAAHTLQSHQSSQQSHVTCEHHYTEQGSYLHDPYQNHELAYKPPVVDNEILEVSGAERNCVYYDMQVLDTNNYVDEFGFIHHNSGKSRAGTFRLICKVLEHPGLNGGYYMPTYDLIKLRAMPGIEEDLNMLGLKYKTNLSDYSIHIAGYGSIILRSYDRPERIVAYETAHSIVDELDTLPKEKAALVWRKITERNRQKSPTPNSIGAVTTPDQGFSGFIYDRWVTRADESTELIKAATTSNPFLPDDYVDNIRRNYDPALAEMYINGEFVSLTANKVYHYFSRTAHHTDRAREAGDKLHVSIDFNVGGCCSLVCVTDGDDPRVVDEFVSQDTRDFINQLARYKGHDITVYPDASGKAEKTNASASDISLIEAAGYMVDAPQMNPFIRDRVNSVNSMLSHDRLKVNTAMCPRLTQSLETQGYEANGKPEKFDSHPAIDDWNDSLGYLISRCYPIIRPTTEFVINW